MRLRTFAYSEVAVAYVPPPCPRCARKECDCRACPSCGARLVPGNGWTDYCPDEDCHDWDDTGLVSKGGDL